MVVELQLAGSASLCWQAPGVRPPKVFMQSSKELRKSEEWRKLLKIWEESLEGALADEDHSVGGVSGRLWTLLQQLVGLAGGWVKRPVQRRKAYDSTKVRCVRARMADLHRVEVLSRPQVGSRCGSWTRPLELLCAKLRRNGVVLPEGSYRTSRFK